MAFKIHNVDAEIREKWTTLVANSANASVYEYPDILDALCEWEIIARPDFSGAMALPFKRQLGFKRYYQPPFIQQCRWIGEPLTQAEIGELSSALAGTDTRINTNWRGQDKDTERVNQILQLADKETLWNKFSKDLKKNIRKNEAEFTVVHVSDAQLAIGLYKEAYGSLNAHLKARDYQQFALLIEKAIRANKAVALYAHSETDEQAHAAAIFLKGHGRLHYVLGAPSPAGRKKNALSVLLWELIKEYSNNEWVLDFEGSSIPSVAAFYNRFGAQEEYFYEFKKTNLLFSLLSRIKGMLASSK